MAGESASDAARRMREKAERLARSAERWERGAVGERATAEVLDRLPRTEWTVFHDVRWPGRRLANVDHVAIGPPGVFVIDSKNWSGSIGVRDNVLRHNGRKREPAVANAAEAALAVAGLTRLVRPDLVFPVLCFVRDEQITGWARDVMVCSTANLQQMLLTRPRVLEADVRRQLCLDIDVSLRNATEPGGHAPGRAGGGAPAAPQTPRHVTKAPRTSRRRGKSQTGLVARLLAVVALMAALLSPLRQEFADWWVSLAANPGKTETSTEAVELDSLVGTWKGSYSCPQGDTPARLIVSRSGGAMTAVLSFDVAARTTPSRGRFRLSAIGTPDQVTLRPTEWIERPPGYSMIGLVGKVDGKEFTGEVTTAGCATFAFRRAR